MYPRFAPKRNPLEQAAAEEYMNNALEGISRNARLVVDFNAFQKQHADSGFRLFLSDVDKALASHEDVSNLKMLSLSGLPLDHKNIGTITKWLEDNPQLESLSLTDGKFDPFVMERLAPAIKKHPGLRSVTLFRSELTPKDAETFIREGYHHGLVEFQLGYNPEIYPALTEFNKGLTNDNLLSCSTIGEPNVVALTKRNRERIGTLIATLSESLDSITAPQLRQVETHKDKFDSRWFQSYWEGMGNFSLDYPSDFLKSPEKKAALNTLLESLPPFPATENPEGLFTPNESGFAPVDNPRLWEGKTIEDFKALPLTAELLAKRTEKGGNLLDTALFAFPAADVLDALNQQGITLRGEMLLSDDKPSALLEQLIDDGKAPALFTPDNWRGATRKELLKAYEALPETQQQQTGIHGLLQQISTTQRGLGR